MGGGRFFRQQGAVKTRRARVGGVGFWDCDGVDFIGWLILCFFGSYSMFLVEALRWSQFKRKRGGEWKGDGVDRERGVGVGNKMRLKYS
jgi:hypothetical protein